MVLMTMVLVILTLRTSSSSLILMNDVMNADESEAWCPVTTERHRDKITDERKLSQSPQM